MFIHQRKNWTAFIWNNDTLLPLLANVRHLQGRLLGQMESLGFKFQEEALLSTLTLDVLKSNEIEGEVRVSFIFAKKLLQKCFFIQHST